MPVNLFSFIDLYDRTLDTAAHILTKGGEHAKSQGIEPAEMLDWRLIEDMSPLRFQIMVICNFTRQWPARVVGSPVPDDISDGLNLPEFLAELAGSKAYLATLTPQQFEGRDDVALTVSLGGGTLEPTLPAGRWLSGFASTNLYFHLSIAYAILRAKGVALGKVDLFPTGL